MIFCVGLSMMSYKKDQKASLVVKKALIYSEGDFQLRGSIEISCIFVPMGYSFLRFSRYDLFGNFTICRLSES